MKLTVKEIQTFIYSMSNISIVVAMIFLLLYLMAPLLGGLFYVTPIIYYGSWVVYALCVKYEAKNFLQFKTKKLQFILVNILEIGCFLILYEFIFAIIFASFLFFLKTAGANYHIKNEHEVFNVAK